MIYQNKVTLKMSDFFESFLSLSKMIKILRKSNPKGIKFGASTISKALMKFIAYPKERT